jgi:hypothetical protein
MELIKEKSPKSLEQALLQSGSISKIQFNEALNHFKRTGNRITRSLVELGYISEKRLMNTISEVLDIPNLSLAGLEINPSVIKLIPYELARSCGSIPILLLGNVLMVATDDPFDGKAVNRIARHTKKEIKTALVTFSDIQSLLKKYDQSKNQKLSS